MEVLKPTIADFTNSNHTHTSTASGGDLFSPVYTELTGDIDFSLNVQYYKTLTTSWTPNIINPKNGVMTFDITGAQTINTPTIPSGYTISAFANSVTYEDGVTKMIIQCMGTKFQWGFYK